MLLFRMEEKEQRAVKSGCSVCVCVCMCDLCVCVCSALAKKLGFEPFWCWEKPRTREVCVLSCVFSVHSFVLNRVIIAYKAASTSALHGVFVYLPVCVSVCLCVFLIEMACRCVAFARYADILWMETAKPILSEVCLSPSLSASFLCLSLVCVGSVFRSFGACGCALVDVCIQSFTVVQLGQRGNDRQGNTRIPR